LKYIRHEKACLNFLMG